MEVVVDNIQILHKNEFSPDTPTRYCVSVSFAETDTPYFREATITVRFNADENAQMKDIENMAISKAKEFIENSLSEF